MHIQVHLRRRGQSMGRMGRTGRLCLTTQAEQRREAPETSETHTFAAKHGGEVAGAVQASRHRQVGRLHRPVREAHQHLALACRDTKGKTT